MIFVDIGLKKKQIFDNLDANLGQIKTILLKNDPDGKLYLFGSMVKGNANMASDIDLLIVTASSKNKILEDLDRNNLRFPFEFHIRNSKEAEPYFRHVKELRRL